MIDQEKVKIAIKEKFGFHPQIIIKEEPQYDSVTYRLVIPVCEFSVSGMAAFMDSKSSEKTKEDTIKIRSDFLIKEATNELQTKVLSSFESEVPKIKGPTIIPVNLIHPDVILCHWQHYGKLKETMK